MDNEKKYNELVGKIKKAYLYAQTDSTKAVLEDILPEIKESKDEDERIRKGLLKMFNHYVRNNIELNEYDLDKDMVLAWLEKQKEFVSADFDDVWKTADCDELTAPLEKYSKDAIKEMCHAWYDKGIELERKRCLEKQGEQKSIWHNEDEEPQRDSLILLVMQSGTPIVAKIIEPNHTFNHGERWAYIDDLLEKQGEQKLTNSYCQEHCKGFHNRPVTERIKTFDDALSTEA